MKETPYLKALRNTDSLVNVATQKRSKYLSPVGRSKGKLAGESGCAVRGGAKNTKHGITTRVVTSKKFLILFPWEVERLAKMRRGHREQR